MLPQYKTIPTPVGELILVARGTKLAAILWENERLNRVRLGPLELDNDHPTLKETERQLLEYFAGQRRQFELALDFAGTDFQVRVWQALLTIPFGETRSYRDPDRPTDRDTRCRCCQRPQPDLDHCPMPPRHRHLRQPHRFRRRPCG
jgi:O6-methylguanine-DNA--protein-cysteine methyltransferase